MRRKIDHHATTRTCWRGNVCRSLTRAPCADMKHHSWSTFSSSTKLCSDCLWEYQSCEQADPQKWGFGDFLQNARTLSGGSGGATVQVVQRLLLVRCSLIKVVYELCSFCCKRLCCSEVMLPQSQKSHVGGCLERWSKASVDVFLRFQPYKPNRSLTTSMLKCSERQISFSFVFDWNRATEDMKNGAFWVPSRSCYLAHVAHRCLMDSSIPAIQI